MGRVTQHSAVRSKSKDTSWKQLAEMLYDVAVDQLVLPSMTSWCSHL